MKEHGSKLPAEQPVKILKSLLKKPGQTKGRGRKNRVVINEKLNEFFAADYIILIKEECCPDEDCDCCCQEHELIRLGNCKECRAKLNLHFGLSEDDRYLDAAREHTYGGDRFDCVELHVEDEEDVGYEIGTDGDEDETYDGEEVEKGNLRVEMAEDKLMVEETEEEEEEHVVAEEDSRGGKKREKAGNGHRIGKSEKGAGESNACDANHALLVPPNLTTQSSSSSSPSRRPRSQDQHHETLSPPEGYKDVYANEEISNVAECCPACRPSQRTTGTDIGDEVPRLDRGTNESSGEPADETSCSSPMTPQNESSRHRYLVETITMTTVTERRIVRKISEKEEGERRGERRGERDETCDGGGEEETADGADGVEVEEELSSKTEACMDTESLKEEWKDYCRTPVLSCSVSENDVRVHGTESTDAFETRSNADKNRSEGVESGVEDRVRKANASVDDGDAKTNVDSGPSDRKELSLAFKLASTSLTGNSSKPNSAVRQLFPNPKFVSPPPAPLAKLISTSRSLDDTQGGPAFLPNAENLRFVGVAERPNMPESQVSTESDRSSGSLVERTIERGMLRRGLLEKYRTNARKKGLPSKHLSLEERIRRLTCVDPEEEEKTVADAVNGADSTARTEEIIAKSSTTSTVSSASQEQDAFARSPAAQVVSATVTPTEAATLGTSVPHPCSTGVATTTVIGSSYLNKQHEHRYCTTAVNTVASDNVHGHSAYKKLTDLFVVRKSAAPSMPDLGLGGDGKIGHPRDVGLQPAKNSTKVGNTSDARRQFLASLAPLSCVTANTADTEEDCYLWHSGTGARNNETAVVSPYDVADVDAVSHANIRNFVGPPDVTKGTPPILGSRPDIGDGASDELLAFVEQDKFRTERIKRRYNDIDGRAADAWTETSETGRIEFALAYHENVTRVQGRLNGRLSLVEREHDTAIDNAGNGGRTKCCNEEGDENRVEGKQVERKEEKEEKEKREKKEKKEEEEEEGNEDDDGDDDDEMNDYGFNRRPSVTGIKQRQPIGAGEALRRGGTLPQSNNANVPRTNILPPSQPIYYENYCVHVNGPIALPNEIQDDSSNSENSFIGPLLSVGDPDANTINRINSMQKQIDDIYQTIVENTHVTGPTSFEAGTAYPCAEETSAFVRQYPSYPESDSVYRLYQDPRNGQPCFQEQPNVTTNGRTTVPRPVPTGVEVEMLAVKSTANAGVAASVAASVAPSVDYANGLPAKRRHGDEMPCATTPPNYRCSIVPATTAYAGIPAGIPAGGKCLQRTMYFVPYNDLSDPTYQNIQRILPSHPSASYANHVERYPYPRNNKNDYRPQLPTQMTAASQPLRYYHVAGSRSMSPVSGVNQNDHHLPPSLATGSSVASIAHSSSSGSCASFDPRIASISPQNSIALSPSSQQPLHLHSHHRHHQQQQPLLPPPPLQQHPQQRQQPQQHDDFRVAGGAFSPTPPYAAAHALPLHHHAQQRHHLHHRHHHPQPVLYRFPSTLPGAVTTPASTVIPSYAVLAPSRCATFASNGDGSYRFYQVHLGRTVLATSPSDVLSAPTVASFSPSSSTSCLNATTASFSPSLSSFPSATAAMPEAGNVANFDLSAGLGPVPPASTPSTGSALSAPPSSCSSSTSTSSSSSSSASCSSSSSSSSSSSCSSSSSLQIPPCSPPKMQQRHQQILGPYATMERGVPEGAASVPPQDLSQSGVMLAANSFVAHKPTGIQVLPPHAQNSVYYAMNV